MTAGKIHKPAAAVRCDSVGADSQQTAQASGLKAVAALAVVQPGDLTRQQRRSRGRPQKDGL